MKYFDDLVQQYNGYEATARYLFERDVAADGIIERLNRRLEARQIEVRSKVLMIESLEKTLDRLVDEQTAYESVIEAALIAAEGKLGGGE